MCVTKLIVLAGRVRCQTERFPLDSVAFCQLWSYRLKRTNNVLFHRQKTARQ